MLASRLRQQGVQGAECTAGQKAQAGLRATATVIQAWSLHARNQNASQSDASKGSGASGSHSSGQPPQAVDGASHWPGYLKRDPLTSNLGVRGSNPFRRASNSLILIQNFCAIFP